MGGDYRFRVAGLLVKGRLAVGGGLWVGLGDSRARGWASLESGTNVTLEGSSSKHVRLVGYRCRGSRLKLSYDRIQSR